MMLNQISVQDVMNPSPVTIGPEAGLDDVLMVFAQNNIQCLPVVDEKNTLLGSIVLEDVEKSRHLYDLKEYFNIIVSTLTEESRLRLTEEFAMDHDIRISACEMMTTKAPLVQPTDSLQVLATCLIQHRCHHALITTPQHTLQGLVSIFDILKQLQNAF